LYKRTFVQTYIIGIISQKGGVGKSTLSRALACAYSQAGWAVLIADLDTSQSTSYEWNSRRLASGIEPYVQVQQFPSMDRVKKVAGNYDMVLCDGAPHATRGAEQIARSSDLVLLPTGSSTDDLNPQIRLAHELLKKGVARDKILFVLCRVGGSETEIADTVAYVESAGYKAAAGSVPEKAGYRQAMDDGKTVTETSFATLNKRADEVIQSVVDHLKARG